MINIKNFNPNLLNIDKISYKNTDAVVYSIKYIIMASVDNENVDSKTPLWLMGGTLINFSIFSRPQRPPPGAIRTPRLLIFKE